MVEDIYENSVGVTREKVLATTKLELLRYGIKSTSTTNPYISINVNVLDITVGERVVGQAYHVAIGLSKNEFEADTYYFDRKTSRSGMIIRSTYEDFERAFKQYLEEFLVDYLETNME